MTPIRNLSLLSILLLLAGCVTFYTGVVTMTEVVDTSMKMWADLARRGMTTEAVNEQVTLAHDQYRAACAIARDALIAYKQSGDPTTYEEAVKSAKNAANNLLNFIVPLLSPSDGTKLRTELDKAKTI